MRAQRNCRTAMDGALQVHGLSIAQYAVLRRLEQAPGLSGAELARRLYVTAQTVNRLIGALEQAGLIERFADAGNPRMLRARLTEAGCNAVVSGRRTVEEVEARLLQALDVREQGAFVDMLRRCVEALDLPPRESYESNDGARWEPQVIGPHEQGEQDSLSQA
jgi:DNA-binding MarR family transcriptional regulator